MKKSGIVLTLVGLMIFVLGYIGGAAYTIFGFVSSFSDYPEDFYNADIYTIWSIVNASLILLIGGSLIAITAITLSKNIKGKKVGVVDFILLIMSSMQVYAGISSLMSLGSTILYTFANSVLDSVTYPYLINAFATGTVVKALGCMFIVIGVCRMIINKQRKIKEE